MKKRLTGLVLALFLIWMLAGSVSGSQPGQYTITLRSTGPGVAELYADSANARDRVYFLADPEPGYRVSFDRCGYYKEQVEMKLYYIGSNIYEILMPDGDVMLDLEFVAIESESHPVTVTAGEGGMVTVSQTTAKAGESIFLEVIALPGVRLDAVLAASGGSPVEVHPQGRLGEAEIFEIFMPDGPLQIDVSFQKTRHRVSVAVEEPGGGWAVPEPERAVDGELVTLTCIPDEGYRVARVEGVEGLTDLGGGVYSFRMGCGPAALSVLFLRENNPFLDVNESHFYHDSVLWAVERGITSGVDESHFAPSGLCNRAQAVTFLWRAAGCPAGAGAQPFADVPAGTWYADAVCWAVEQGIVRGLTETTFGPDAACSRAQVVTFLWRAMGAPAASAEHCFEDVQPGSWYADAVTWAVEQGITTGMTEHTFGPGEGALRAQVVTFLHRWDRLGEAAE